MNAKKKIEIEDLIHRLDLTPAMYDNAVNKYEELRRIVKQTDDNISFYPQGSFMLGTTVRPYSGQKEKDYDLDAICLFNLASTETTPKNVRNMLEEILLNSKYKEKLKLYDRCITIEYADYGTIGFNIDIASSAFANEATKSNMITRGCALEYVETAIEISEIK